MSNQKELFFIGLLLPEEVSKVTTEIKQHFADVYESKAALKSPPHITLQSPFQWKLEDLPTLEKQLEKFANNQNSVPIILDGFATFKPRVIYINVLKTTELLELQNNLMQSLERSLGIVHLPSKNRDFSPHVTVGFKDLTKANFYRAWDEFKSKPIYFEFTVGLLTLLHHNGICWEIHRHYPLNF